MLSPVFLVYIVNIFFLLFDFIFGNALVEKYRCKHFTRMSILISSTYFWLTLLYLSWHFSIVNVMHDFQKEKLEKIF